MAKIHGFAEAIIKLYKGKKVEINTGESATSLSYSDYEARQKHVVRGVIKDAIGDGIIVSCCVNDVDQDVLLNVWSIISIMELTGHGNISDIYIDEFKERKYSKKH